MKNLGLNPSDEELAKMIDAEKSELNFKDFAGLIMRIVNKSKVEEVRAYFHEFDTDNDGTITVSEARKYFEKEGLPEEEIDKYIKSMFESMDLDKDCKITINGMLTSVS